MTERRFYEAEQAGARRSAPAALRNRGPIADVLSDWLPANGLVLEVASGTGEHVVYFAKRLPALEWQPSDMHEDALNSIRAWRAEAGLANVREPLNIDVTEPDWPFGQADALLSINMVHISPWEAALGLLAGARRILPKGAPLILYGPWISGKVETAASNLAFDEQLKKVDSRWGLRSVEDFTEAAEARGFRLTDQRQMPANNMMLRFLRTGQS
jgi:hypothetical protein